MTEETAAAFGALAQRWDLRRLRDDLVDTLNTVEPAARPYVPDQLARCLHMFLDSYDLHGPPAARP